MITFVGVLPGRENEEGFRGFGNALTKPGSGL